MTTPEPPEFSDSPDEAGWAAPARPDAAPALPPPLAPPPGPVPAPAPPLPPAPAVPSAAWAAPPSAYPAAVYAPATGLPPTRATVNGMAVASLVLGLCCWCFFVPGILAVIFGNLALGKIATSDGRQKGRGMAIAGIVLGWISIAVLAGLAIAWLAYGLSNG